MNPNSPQFLIIILLITALVIGAYFLGIKQGRNVVNPPVTISPTAAPTITTEGCKRAGCSNELCVDESSENVFSPCIYKEEFACYKTAKCERQADGKCGFTQTEELKKCLGR